MIDKNCHNNKFVTISVVTISGKHCIVLVIGRKITEILA